MTDLTKNCLVSRSDKIQVSQFYWHSNFNQGFILNSENVTKFWHSILNQISTCRSNNIWISSCLSHFTMISHKKSVRSKILKNFISLLTPFLDKTSFMNRPFVETQPRKCRHVLSISSTAFTPFWRNFFR